MYRPAKPVLKSRFGRRGASWHQNQAFNLQLPVDAISFGSGYYHVPGHGADGPHALMGVEIYYLSAIDHGNRGWFEVRA